MSTPKAPRVDGPSQLDGRRWPLSSVRWHHAPPSPNDFRPANTDPPNPLTTPPHGRQSSTPAPPMRKREDAPPLSSLLGRRLGPAARHELRGLHAVQQQRRDRVQQLSCSGQLNCVPVCLRDLLRELQLPRLRGLQSMYVMAARGGSRLKERNMCACSFLWRVDKLFICLWFGFLSYVCRGPKHTVKTCYCWASCSGSKTNPYSTGLYAKSVRMRSRAERKCLARWRLVSYPLTPPPPFF